jgi:TDG/mug DNA glycosylase family protein
LTRAGLRDVLEPGVRCIFVGINPGIRSAEAGHHFANPRNDFWRLLFDSGLTPRPLEPAQEAELAGLGLGITNAALRVTRGSGELRRADFAGSQARLAEIEQRYGPAVFAFVGKQAYAGVFTERTEHGLSKRRLGNAQLYVLPSTSPANAAVPYAEKLRWFKRLAARVESARL